MQYVAAAPTSPPLVRVEDVMSFPMASKYLLRDEGDAGLRRDPQVAGLQDLKLRAEKSPVQIAVTGTIVVALTWN